eukprot:Opistho-2@26801
MAQEAISLAITIAKTIYKMTEEYREQDERLGELVGRINSLEQPLNVLNKQSENLTVYKDALIKLVRLLQECQLFIDEQIKDMIKTKVMKFLRGTAKLERFSELNRQLDSCQLDLQTAVQAEEAVRSEARVHETASATVDLLTQEKIKRANEALRPCVQCGQDYRESVNPEGGCKFHSGFPLVNYGKRDMTCCNKSIPEKEAFETGCVLGRHTSKHHSRYSYAAFYKFCQSLHRDEKEEYARAEKNDFEDSMAKAARCGTMEAESPSGEFYVALMKGNFVLFLQRYGQEEAAALAAEAKRIVAGVIPIGARGTDELPGPLEQAGETKWRSWAEFIVANGAVTAIRLYAKSLSHNSPAVKEVPISVFPPQKLGEAKSLSNEVSARPSLQFYTLPPKVEVFKPFPPHVFHEPPPQENPATVTTGGLPLRLKRNGDLICNYVNGNAFDSFDLDVSLMNTGHGERKGASHEERLSVLTMLKEGKISVDESLRLLAALEDGATLDGPIRIIEVRAEALLNGVWTPAMEVRFIDEKISFPIEVRPQDMTRFSVRAFVKAEGKRDTAGGWGRSAYIARFEPVHLRFIFEEFSGKIASTSIVFQNPAQKFAEKKDDDIAFISCDVLDKWYRSFVRFTKPDDEGALFKISIDDCRSFTVQPVDVEQWAYSAKKANSSEFRLEFLCECQWEAHAVVDIKAGIAYAIKFETKREGGVHVVDHVRLQ